MTDTMINARIARIAEAYVRTEMGWDRCRVAGTKADPEVADTWLALVEDVAAGDEAGQPFAMLIKRGEVVEDSLAADDYHRN